MTRDVDWRTSLSSFFSLLHHLTGDCVMKKNGGVVVAGEVVAGEVAGEVVAVEVVAVDVVDMDV